MSMFDALKNLGSLPGLMAKAKEMQEKMRAAQEELGRKQVSADAGGGMVAVGRSQCAGRVACGRRSR